MTPPDFTSSPPSPNILHVPGVELSGNQLRCGPWTTRLGSRTGAVCALLFQEWPEPVHKGALLAALKPDGHESGKSNVEIASILYKLRHAFQEVRAPVVLETYRGRGYGLSVNASAAIPSRDAVSFKGVTLDPVSGRMAYNGSPARLDPQLASVGALLMASPEHVVPHERFIRALWPEPADQPKTAATMVRNLVGKFRDRLEDLDTPVQVISAHHQGYKLAEIVPGRFLGSRKSLLAKSYVPTP